MKVRIPPWKDKPRCTYHPNKEIFTQQASINIHNLQELSLKKYSEMATKIYATMDTTNRM